MDRYLGIDLGGTKTAVCVGNELGELACTRRMPTGADTAPEDWLKRLGPLVDEVLREARLTTKDIRCVGVAAPGPMSVHRKSVLAPPNMPAWRNVPVGCWVEELTGLPIRINNDANAAALAEYLFGDRKGTPDLVYLTLSTGIGGGVISGGRLIQGADDLGGEVGHFVLDPAGPPCPCGQRGCFEMYCGGRNVLLQVADRLASGEPSILREGTGGTFEDLTVTAVARAAQQGDRLATEFWERFIDRLAQGIGIVAMCFNPSVIILGTIAIHTGDLLLTPLRERLPRFAWPQTLQHLQIRPSALGTKIGELGALALAVHESNTSSEESR